MPGRPRSFDTEEVFDRAMQLFWSRGYEATSLEDLISTMGLSKSSFYQTFGSKQTLFEQCLVHYGDMLAAETRSALEKAPDAATFIRHALNMVADETQGVVSRRGCLLMNTAAECAQRDKQIALCVTKGINTLTDVLEDAVCTAQHEGSIRKNRAPATLASYLITTISGLKTMVKAGASKKQVLAVAKVALEGLGLE